MEHNCITRSFYSLGTMNYIKICNCDDEAIMGQAITRVLAIDDLMSAYKGGSDVSRINSNSGKGFINIHPDTMKVLSRSLDFSRISYGAFDITIRPLVELWGIGKKSGFIPSDEEINKIRMLVNYKNVLLDQNNCRVSLELPGQAIDLGGIAKGFAADEVKRILLENHIKSALINLGGNIITIGNRPDGIPWQIGIQNPVKATGTHIGILNSSCKTIVTSGSNERFFVKDGVRYHHILDPHTGKPANTKFLSVTAVSGCSMDADALTTAVFILGKDFAYENEGGYTGKRWLNLAKKLDAEVIIISSDAEIIITDGLKDNFKVRS
ncbi:MAG TPA: FAD:protein FMN transferase [Pseudobacteroides sp.]|uniref:FAD:protein FMN transferase n=1 Tax=Pseudobacteroides sp. TaxID=1968840 RepID=UPI002F94EB5A